VIGGLIIAHEQLGESIIGALELISGTPELIHAVSNVGLSTSQLVDNIRECAIKMPEGYVVFVDVYGGSCWRAAKMAVTADYHIVTGVNLPMLLSFVNKRKKFSFEELPAILEADGKRGIITE